MRGSRATSYVPFESDRVVEPPAGHVPVRMAEVLPPEMAAAYNDVTGMLSDDAIKVQEAADLNSRYCSLLGERAEYLRYLARADVRDMWELVPESSTHHSMSVAAVLKKNGRD